MVTDFFKHNILDTIQHFSIIFDCSSSALHLFGSHLPHLRSLFIHHSNIIEGILVFPESLSRLKELKLTASSTRKQRIFDISALTLLSVLSVVCRSRVFIKGFSKLNNLQSLELRDVIFNETLHSEVRLFRLSIDHLSSEALSLLLKNIHCFANCMFSISNCEALIDHQDFVQSRMVSLVTSYSRRREINYSTFSNRFPVLRDLKVRVYTDVSLQFHESSCLQSLEVLQTVDCKLFLHLPAVVRLSKLVLSDTSSFTLSLFLKHCPFLLHLELYSLTDEFSTIEYEGVSLNYLRVLRLTEVPRCCNFFRGFPTMPRLCELSIVDTLQFNLDVINSQCPRLKFLEIEDCKVVQSLTTPNFSVINLKMTQGDCCNFPNSLNLFEGVSQCSCTISRLLPVSYFSFPPNVRVANLQVPFINVKESFIIPACLLVLSGVLLVDTVKALEAENWILEFKRNYTHVTVNLKLEVVKNSGDFLL
ncbi:hypothetical protein RCL1_008707 [Eukaryota sp. TZLM3-RCL]